MRFSHTSDASFTIEFESEEELREEHSANLVYGGLRLVTTTPPALHSAVNVTLRGPSGAEVPIRATVVAPIAEGAALFFEANADELLARLLPPPLSVDEQIEPEKPGSVVDRLREMPRVQKIIFAAKADRTERAFLVQDRDPQVLTSVLRNPRITIDEVVRVAKSAFLNYQVAELILKTGQFMGSVEVRVALVHNPKTPPQFALRILPTLPEAEVRTIARGAATSMQLKQAALKRLQGVK